MWGMERQFHAGDGKAGGIAISSRKIYNEKHKRYKTNGSVCGGTSPAHAWRKEWEFMYPRITRAVCVLLLFAILSSLLLSGCGAGTEPSAKDTATPVRSEEAFVPETPTPGKSAETPKPDPETPEPGGNTPDKGEKELLEIAFGLFSMELPGGTHTDGNTGDALSDFRFATDGEIQLIRANCAPLAEYEAAAGAKLDSYVSLLFVMAGENYSETEIREETLENGIRLRWQTMGGDSLLALWFEAFDDSYGYNVCMETEPGEENEKLLTETMRSFRVDPERERDLLEIRQTVLPDGDFISVEHGLRIHLSEEWDIISQKGMLLPGTAFILEKEKGRWMIQLFSMHPAGDEDPQSLLEWLLSRQGAEAAAKDAYDVTLENLGITARVAEVKAGVTMLHVAFVYEGYGYYGLFMWVPDDDAQARPFMTEALKSLGNP